MEQIELYIINHSDHEEWVQQVARRRKATFNDGSDINLDTFSFFDLNLDLLPELKGCDIIYAYVLGKVNRVDSAFVPGLYEFKQNKDWVLSALIKGVNPDRGTMYKSLDDFIEDFRRVAEGFEVKVIIMEDE